MNFVMFDENEAMQVNGRWVVFFEKPMSIEDLLDMKISEVQKAFLAHFAEQDISADVMQKTFERDGYYDDGYIHVNGKRIPFCEAILIMKQTRDFEKVLEGTYE